MNLPKEEALSYWPFVVQTVCCLISSGFSALYTSTLSLIRANASVKVVLASVHFEVQHPKVSCFLYNLQFNGSMYSTGIAMIALASQRFILVKRPFTAQQTLTKKYYVIIGSICTVLPSTLIVSAFLAASFFTTDCDQTSFFNYGAVRAIAYSIIFYLAPVILCLCLYIPVGIELWKKETQAARNRELTILFLTSCLTWIVLWFPAFLFLLIFQSSETVVDIFSGGYFRLFLWLCHQPLFHLFSAVNPIIFIFCYKHSQSPLKAICHRCVNDSPT